MKYTKKIDVFNIINFLESGALDTFIREYLIVNPDDYEGAHDYVMRHLIDQEGFNLLLNTTPNYMALVERIEQKLDASIKRITNEFIVY